MYLANYYIYSKLLKTIQLQLNSLFPFHYLLNNRFDAVIIQLGLKGYFVSVYVS